MPVMPDVPRRRLRFGMRALLAALTVAAVASWLYWDGWGRYLSHIQQREFKSNVQQVKIGMITDDAQELLGTAGFHKIGYTSAEDDNLIVYLWYKWPNANYVIFGRTKPKYRGMAVYPQFESVEVYRISGSLLNHVAKTEFGKNASPGYWSEPDEVAGLAFREFVAYLNSDRRASAVIEHTLIHSDLPVE
jgi:hypothetical protein